MGVFLARFQLIQLRLLTSVVKHSHECCIHYTNSRLRLELVSIQNNCYGRSCFKQQLLLVQPQMYHEKQFTPNHSINTHSVFQKLYDIVFTHLFASPKMNLKYVTGIADTSHQDYFHCVQSNVHLLNRYRPLNWKGFTDKTDIKWYNYSYNIAFANSER